MKEFPPFRLDTANQCLWRRGDTQDDERILLTPKAFAVLCHLVEHAGRLVTQNELLEAVWPDTFVQPEVLKYQIADIRGTLGDHPRNPLFIETLPRRGYRFVATVTEGESAGALAPASPAGGRLVGRNHELEALRACLLRALKGQRQVVFITGEPGIGKTALVDEFQRQAAAEEPSLRISRGQCVEGYGGAEAYYPMLEALGQLCHGPDGKRVVEILAAQAPTWLVQFPALLKREQCQTLQQEILGATRDRMLREIREALDTLNLEGPLLWVFEDLQWVDPSTVNLISALARQRQTAKAMVIITKRPVDMVAPEHPLKRLKQDLLIHHLCREITLAPLAKADVAEYLGPESPEGFAELIHRHSEGNPLFMIAALEHMTEHGQISRENGSWRLRVPIEEIALEVPETLRQMIESQIEHLTSEQQRALEVASVNGVLFSASGNGVAAGLDDGKFEDLCDELSRRHRMVRRAGSRQFPDGTVSVRHEFTHALYREVFYHRQTPGRRAKLHLRVGERLDRRRNLNDWYWRMPLEWGLTQLWLAQGDLTEARPQAERFLSLTLTTAEHTWQALAWEVNARVAMAELDLTRAQDFIATALSTMEGYEVPLAAWRVHATACELCRRAGDRDAAERHRGLSGETIMKLANSLPAEEPLRHIFLSSPMVRRILGDGETQEPRPKASTAVGRP